MKDTPLTKEQSRRRKPDDIAQQTTKTARTLCHLITGPRLNRFKTKRSGGTCLPAIHPACVRLMGAVTWTQGNPVAAQALILAATIALIFAGHNHD